jgi:2'-5' RNA ligase
MPTRTFLAIELDDATRAFVAMQAQPVQAALPRVRFAESATWHITLAFLGELNDAQLAAAHQAASDAAAHCAPFVLRAGGIGTFGPVAAPRVIWVGVDGDRVALQATHARVVEALAAHHLTHDGRFSPHITLARPRQAFTPTEYAAFSNLCAHGAQGPALPVTAISVMKSVLAPTGARYTCLARASFPNGASPAT